MATKKRATKKRATKKRATKKRATKKPAAGRPTKKRVKKKRRSKAKVRAADTRNASDGEVNKSQAIRDLMAANPQLKPAAIAQRLEKQGIEVSAQYVSTIKSNTKRQRSRVGLTDSDAPLPSDMSVAQLLEIRELADRLGGFAKMRRALDVLEELQED